MKNVVLSVALSLCLTVPAWSQEETPDTYFSLSAGMIFPDDSEHEGVADDLGISHDIEIDTGYAFRGAIGKHLTPFRVELELGYQDTEVDDISGTGLVSNDVDGDLSILSLMVNGYVDFPVTNWMDIYIGGGIGPAWVEGDLSGSGTVNGTPASIDLEKDDDVIFAYQALAGATFHLNEQWALTAGYRLWSGTDPEFGSGEYDTPVIHTAEVGVRFSF